MNTAELEMEVHKKKKLAGVKIGSRSSL